MNESPTPTVDPIPGLALSLESSFFGFYAHAGFAAALYEHGIRPQFLAGASSGSVIAVLLGAGFSHAEIKALIFNPKFKWSFWELKSFARGIAMMFWWPGVSGLTTAGNARKFLHNALKDRAPNIEDCNMAEVSIAVANLNQLRTDQLKSGECAAAIVASCAFPCLVAPQKLEDEFFWDGGIANSTPYLHYAEDPRVTTIITHHIQHRHVVDQWNQPGFRPRISDTVARGHQLITEEINRLHLRRMQDAGKTMLAVNTIAERPGLFSKMALQERCYEAGRESGLKFAAQFQPK